VKARTLPPNSIPSSSAMENITHLRSWTMTARPRIECFRQLKLSPDSFVPTVPQRERSAENVCVSHRGSVEVRGSTQEGWSWVWMHLCGVCEKLRLNGRRPVKKFVEQFSYLIESMKDARQLKWFIICTEKRIWSPT
jgi:hypothetical protein